MVFTESVVGAWVGEKVSPGTLEKNDCVCTV